MEKKFNFNFYKESETNFKHTAIGKIPKDWDVKELDSICNIFAGDTAPQGDEYFVNGKYPFVRVQHLNYLEEDKYPIVYDKINEKAVKDYNLKLFKKGSILLAKSGESIRTEKKAILKFDSYVVNHLAVLEVKNENIADNIFLFYYFKNFKLSSLLTQTSMPSINLSTLKRLKVPLPPLEEQKAIAEVLSTFDKRKELLQKKKGIMEKIKKGLMDLLLTGKVRIKIS